MKESSAGQAARRRRATDLTGDAGNYRWKIFYANPEDEAFFVPMRYGGGMDFNYARWPGKLMVAPVMIGLGWILLSRFL
ncbi:hypothetical protein B841_08180 [Corynebacterium maris DSM 45190]|uniref:DUF5808 domain-containing protein n=1 Tax=Corynebacterium maris DSM 45190 TaxID=1224163 RepID=S5SV85_9CORY|nr:DUF5808 domain-containing protein [Corynebacterium maris]AGS35109.1 hypothetical protein B841_08180 [Corynebacterium maris DSM 45190]